MLIRLTTKIPVAPAPRSGTNGVLYLATSPFPSATSTKKGGRIVIPIERLRLDGIHWASTQSTLTDPSAATAVLVGAIQTSSPHAERQRSEMGVFDIFPDRHSAPPFRPCSASHSPGRHSRTGGRVAQRSRGGFQPTSFFMPLHRATVGNQPIQGSGRWCLGCVTACTSWLRAKLAPVTAGVKTS